VLDFLQVQDMKLYINKQSILDFDLLETGETT
jgi:hypothetical protein